MGLFLKDFLVIVILKGLSISDNIVCSIYQSISERARVPFRHFGMIFIKIFPIDIHQGQEQRMQALWKGGEASYTAYFTQHHPTINKFYIWNGHNDRIQGSNNSVQIRLNFINLVIQ